MLLLRADIVGTILLEHDRPHCFALVVTEGPNEERYTGMAFLADADAVAAGRPHYVLYMFAADLHVLVAQIGGTPVMKKK